MLFRKRVSPLTGLMVLALLAGTAQQSHAAADSMQAGKVALVSVGALELGPDGVLFVGDSEGSAVYAIDVEPPKSSGKPLNRIEDLDGKIAARLGTNPRDIFIKDLAVDRDSGTAFLSVMRGQGEDAIPVLVSVTRDGQIGEVALDNVRHSRLEIPNAPKADAKLYRWESRTFTITDLEFIDGELYIAGLSNEEFASTLRRASFPFGDGVEVTGLEIYHGAHGVYETFAPIFSFIPYEIDDKPHLLAGYLCTPLVTFPLDEIRTKKELRGKTIAELGFGNIPTDLVPYKRGDEEYVLIINSSRGVMKVKRSDIEAANKGGGITTEAGPRTGVEDHSVPIGSVLQAADLNDSHMLLLGRSLENGSLYLEARSKSWM